jgi:hypothetical protein
VKREELFELPVALGEFRFGDESLFVERECLAVSVILTAWFFAL